MVKVVFYSVFRSEMHQNDLFFLNHFLKSAHENDLKTPKNKSNFMHIWECG
jgi:hypothetical protein